MGSVTDPPVVLIDGEPVATAYALDRAVVLDNLRITWGREAHTEPAYPAQLAVDLIDTGSAMPRSAHLVGRPITIRRGDDVTIFRGTLDDFKVTPVVVHDSSAFRLKRNAWKIALTASDRLAELATTYPRAPKVDPIWASIVGPGGWPVHTPAERIAALRDEVESLSGIDWRNPYPANLPHIGNVRSHVLDDQMTALDLIEGCYNAHPLGYVNYVPSSNRVTIGKPATTLGLELRWGNDTLTVGLPGVGLAMPAREVILERGAQARTSFREQIASVSIAGAQPKVAGEHDLDYRDALAIAPTAYQAAGIAAQREYATGSDVMYSFLVTEDKPTEGTRLRFEWPFALSTVTSEFGMRDTGMHYGIDMGNPPATARAPIPAAGAGTVITSEYHSGWGNQVVIDHGVASDGKRLKTRYAHMEVLVMRVGDLVDLGDTIGHVGNTGNSFGAHLHLETLVNDVQINPRTFMATYATAPVTPPSPITPGNVPEEVAEFGIWQKRQAADTAAIFNKTNGLLVLPPVRLDWRRFDYRTGIGETFIDTCTKSMPIYFTGSLFAPILEAAAEHEVIGGTLTYEGGWVLDATLAPAIRSRDGVTWAQLVTIDAPTWDDFDPDITFADLGNVTKGVTA